MAESDIKIYGVIFSPPVRAVMMYLKATGTPFEFEMVDLAGGQHKTPEYLAINPNGTVPAMTHGDVSIGESSAIIQYVSEAKGISSNWWPADVKQRGKMYAYIHWHAGIVSKIGGYFFKSIGGPKFFGKTFTDEEIAAAKAECDASMQKINEKLEGVSFLAGTEAPSAADIIALAIIQQVALLAQYDLAPYPNVQAWNTRLLEVDAVKEVQEELMKAAQAFA